MGGDLNWVGGNGWAFKLGGWRLRGLNWVGGGWEV